MKLQVLKLYNAGYFGGCDRAISGAYLTYVSITPTKTLFQRTLLDNLFSLAELLKSCITRAILEVSRRLRIRSIPTYVRNSQTSNTPKEPR